MIATVHRSDRRATCRPMSYANCRANSRRPSPRRFSHSLRLNCAIAAPYQLHNTSEDTQSRLLTAARTRNWRAAKNQSVTEVLSSILTVSDAARYSIRCERSISAQAIDKRSFLASKLTSISRWTRATCHLVHFLL